MNYFTITKDDMLNGEGLRVVLWVAGCSHYCEGCHNSYTWDPNEGILFDESAKQEIFEELSKPYVSGVTFSGGDPLYLQNRETITNLAKEIKQKFPTKNIWLYTGFTFDQVKDLEVMDYVDVVVDGPFEMDLADVNYEWAGSTNQKVRRLTKNEN